jgi:hypothetical protein
MRTRSAHLERDLTSPAAVPPENDSRGPSLHRQAKPPATQAARPVTSREALLEHPGLGPQLETPDLLFRPLAITRHRTIAQALQYRRRVLFDIVIRRQIESPRHGLVVHRAEQRLDVLLEGHPFVNSGHRHLLEDTTSRADPPVGSPSSYATHVAILKGGQAAIRSELHLVAPRSNSGIDVVIGEIICPYQQCREPTKRVVVAFHELVNIGLIVR